MNVTTELDRLFAQVFQEIEKPINPESPDVSGEGEKE